MNCILRPSVICMRKSARDAESLASLADCFFFRMDQQSVCSSSAISSRLRFRMVIISVYSSVLSLSDCFFARADNPKKTIANTKSPYAIVLETAPVISMVIPTARNTIPRIRYLLVLSFILNLSPPFQSMRSYGYATDRISYSKKQTRRVKKNAGKKPANL